MLCRRRYIYLIRAKELLKTTYYACLPALIAGQAHVPHLLLDPPIPTKRTMPQRKVLYFYWPAFAPLAQAAPPIHHIYFDLKTQTYNHVYSNLKELLEENN